MAWCVYCRIWCGLDWGGIGALILALRAIKVGLPIISLKRLRVLALGVIDVSYATWASLGVALILTIRVINSLSMTLGGKESQYPQNS